MVRTPFLIFVCLVAWLAGLVGEVTLMTGSELGSLTLATSVLLAALVMAAWLWRHPPRAMRTLASLRDVRDPSSRRGDRPAGGRKNGKGCCSSCHRRRG